MRPLVTRVVLACLLAAASWASAAEPPVVLREGRVWTAAQPDEAAFAALQRDGVAQVVNVRSVAEMADRTEVPFDETAVLERLGMAYTHAPLSAAGAAPTAAVDALHRALQAGDGPVLLHCASGGRAGLVWAAYQVRHLGRDPESAMRAVPGLWPLQMETLSGVPLRLSRAGDAADAAADDAAR